MSMVYLCRITGRCSRCCKRIAPVPWVIPHRSRAGMRAPHRGRGTRPLERRGARGNHPHTHSGTTACPPGHRCREHTLQQERGHSGLDQGPDLLTGVISMRAQCQKNRLNPLKTQVR